MKLIIVALKDRKANHLHKPFFEDNVTQAKRGFEQEMKNQNSLLALYPGDYALLQLGEIVSNNDESEAEVISFTEPIEICNNKKEDFYKVEKNKKRSKK